MVTCCYNLTGSHILALLIWFFGMFMAAQMVFTPIFGNYTPRMQCTSLGSTSIFGRDCKAHEKCLAENGTISYAEPPQFHSAAMEFGWVCTRWPVVVTTLQFAGVFFGALLFGALSDRYGRKRVATEVFSIGVIVLFLSGEAI